MVKLIITAPREVDVEGFCEIAVTMAGGEYADTVLFPRWDETTAGKPEHRYEIDGREIDFCVANALSKICRIFPLVEMHVENDGTGENYTTPESRVMVIGDGYHSTTVIDTLEGDIDDDALHGLYHDGTENIYADAINRRNAEFWT